VTSFFGSRLIGGSWLFDRPCVVGKGEQGRRARFWVCWGRSFEGVALNRRAFAREHKGLRFCDWRWDADGARVF